MNTIDEIQRLLQKMTPLELSNCRDFLNCFRESDKRSVKLMDLLCGDQLHYSDDELIKILYTEREKKTFNRLAVRLKNRILESLILDANLKNDKSYDERTLLKFDVKKYIIQASILHLKGNVEFAKNLSKKIIEKCKSYELYNELIETLYNQKQIIGLTSGQKAYDKLSNDIIKYERCRVAIYKAQDYFHKLILNVAFKANYEKYCKSLNLAVLDLEGEYKSTKSAHVGYFLYLLKIEYYQELKQYDDAQDYCMRLINLVKNEKAIYMTRRLGTAIANLANIQLYLFSFSSAKKNLEEATSKFPSPSHNYAIVKETEFYANIYSGNFDDALNSINNILTPDYLSLSRFWYYKRIYLKACLLFLQEKYDDVFLTVQEIQEIEEDKEGWNLGIRLLDIFNELERGKFDLVDIKLHNLQIHLHRTAKQYTIRKRDYIIYKLLNELVKATYDFKYTAEKHQNLLSELELQEKDYCWEIKSPEMIVFHEWFKAKAENKKYNHKEAVLKQKTILTERKFRKTG